MSLFSDSAFKLDSSARAILITTGLTATPVSAQAPSAVTAQSAETAVPAPTSAVAVQPATLAPTVKFVSPLSVIACALKSPVQHP